MLATHVESGCQVTLRIEEVQLRKVKDSLLDGEGASRGNPLWLKGARINRKIASL